MFFSRTADVKGKYSQDPSPSGCFPLYCGKWFFWGTKERNPGWAADAHLLIKSNLRSLMLNMYFRSTKAASPAPEVISVSSVQHYDGKLADVWSIGCTVAELFERGKPPWPVEGFPSTWALMLHIVESADGPTIPPLASCVAADFLHQCWERDPYRRPTAEELLRHEFVASKIHVASFIGMSGEQR